MFERRFAFLLAVLGMAVVPAWSQQPCPSYAIVVNSEEDHLLLAINGADTPQEQLAALDKFVAAHPDSSFLPCANEYYATVNLKLKDYDKSIEYAEKDLAANYHDLNLYLTVMRAYAASTKASDTVFSVINKVPEQVKTEIGSVPRPPKVSDAEWASIQKDNADLAKDSHDYAVWAFFQVLPRVSDPAKQVSLLEPFLQTYPEVEKDDAEQLDLIYFQAYRTLGNLDKTTEYGDKIIAEEPNNVMVLNTMGMIYAFYQPHPSTEKAAGYAQKALALAPTLKKPENLDDAAFKKEQDTQLGIAHLTLGYAALVRAGQAAKVAPAIDELKTAGGLLDDNPALQGQALYYLAFAYEKGYPPNHRAATDALNKAVNLPGPFQSQARTLLVKVRAAR